MSTLCLVETEQGLVIDASLRALTFARSLPTKPAALAALLPSLPSPEALEQLRAHGVTDVRHLAEDRLNGYAPLALARALEALSAEEGATSVVSAATDHGNEVLAHLAALAGLDFVANCIEAAPEAGGSLRLVRQRWGGSLLEDAVLTTGGRPAVLSVATEAVLAVPAPAASEPSVVPLRLDLDRAALALQATESAEESGGVSLASAKVVVSGGRGVGGAEGFAVIEELAALLGGAVGVSRVVTSLGWRPHSEQVGQTGTRVTPELYLACGISGAIQHLAGCQSARHMVAINTDPDAPIMSRADYAVIGDLGEVLPALASALRERGSAR